jgi:hypothetical protein
VLGECRPSNRHEPAIFIAVHTNDGQEALRFRLAMHQGLPFLEQLFLERSRRLPQQELALVLGQIIIVILLSENGKLILISEYKVDALLEVADLVPIQVVVSFEMVSV